MVQSEQTVTRTLTNLFHQSPAGHKLPAITLLPHKASGPSYSQSIHKRNHCLAEIIQSQLSELKRLHRYRPRYPLEPNNASQRRPHSAARIPIMADDIPLKQQTNINKLSVEETSNWSGSQRSRILQKSSADMNSQSQMSPLRKADSAAIRASCPNFEMNSPLSDLKQPAISDVQASDNESEITMEQTFNDSLSLDEEALFNSNMDPIKFARVRQWVVAVDKAHKTEGKFSEVIPFPSSDDEVK